MIFAEIVSPNCWFSEKESMLLLPYPQALQSELDCSQCRPTFGSLFCDRKHAIGFLLDVGQEHPVLSKVCSESKDAMSTYITTGKWRKETIFHTIDPTKADLKGVLWFAEDLTYARRKIPEPYATHLANFISEMVARGLKIS